MNGTVRTCSRLWLAIALLLACLSWTPAAAAESTGQYRTDLNNNLLEMRALWGEIDRFQVQAFYCLPPYQPNKEAEIGRFMPLWARADALNGRYIQLRDSLKAFLNGNLRLAAELMLNGATPLDDRWWASYNAERDRMMRARNQKWQALQKAPVRNCAPQPTQVQPPPAFDPPPVPQRPSYAPINFPTIPRQFCSEEEKNRFLIEVVDPIYVAAAENAERAAAFRAQVEAAINTYVQKDVAVPRQLYTLRRQAIADAAEQQRISDAIARFRQHVLDTKVVDCGREEQSHGSTGVMPAPALFETESLRGRLFQASYTFAEALHRCDKAAMAAALAELERLSREAHERNANSDDPYYLQGTPEGDAAEEAEFLARLSDDLIQRAKADLARDCPCTTLPPPGSNVAQTGGQPTGTATGTANGAGTGTSSKPTAPGTISVSLPTTNPYGATYGYPAPEPSPPLTLPGGPVDAKVYDPISQTWVDYHNELRREVGSLPLKWNPLLEAHALEYARVLSVTGQLQHSARTGRENERENIIISRHGSMSPLQMAHSWGNEKKYFRFGDFPGACGDDWSKCAHYTQIVWSTTTDIGCGFAQGKKFDAFVCRYSPPGNKDGKPVLVPAQQVMARWVCPPPPPPPPPPPAP